MYASRCSAGLSLGEIVVAAPPDSPGGGHAMRLRILICLLGLALAFSVAAERWPFSEDNSDPWPRSHGLVVNFVGYSNADAIIHVKNLSNGRVHLEPWVQIDYADGHADARRLSNTNLPSGGTLSLSFAAPTNRVVWKAGVLGCRPWARGLEQRLNSTWFFRRHPLGLSYRCGWTTWQNGHDGGYSLH